MKGTWEVLADGEDSFLWKHPQIAAEHMKVSPGQYFDTWKKGREQVKCDGNGCMENKTGKQESGDWKTVI